MRHVRSAIRRPLALVPLALALALAAWQLRDTRTLMHRGHVGEIQLERVPGNPDFAADYAAFLAWARATWDARDADYRISFRADRNAALVHGLAGVHPHPELQAGLHPRRQLRPQARDRRPRPPAPPRRPLHRRHRQPAARRQRPRRPVRADPRLRARRPRAPRPPRGHGPAHHRTALARRGPARARHRRAPTSAPAWSCTSPVTRAGSSPSPPTTARPNPSSGTRYLSSGTARSPPRPSAAPASCAAARPSATSGHEPTLIAAPARDGTYELRYLRWRRVDILALALTLAGLLALLILARSRTLLPRLLPWARRLTHPILLTTLLVLALALAALRHHRGSVREHDLASARLRRGDAEATRMHPGPLKTDMILFPAVLAAPGRNNLSEATFKNIQLGPTLAGWYALDDDDAKLRRRGSHRLRIFARPHATDTWTPLADLAVRHRPDRRHLDEVTVPPALQSIAVDLRVEIETTGEAPPKIGFDLTLPEAAP
jgi:hypothetical protein